MTLRRTEKGRGGKRVEVESQKYIRKYKDYTE